MKRYLSKHVGKIGVIGCVLLMFSCKKILDLKPQDQVDATNNYRNVYDANAAVIGIYGQMLNLASQYIVLNELRADLMDVTANADKYLKEVTTHSVTIGNPWADPRPFYKVILNCNDALKNFDIMLAGNKMSSSDYVQRYSDIACVRAWLYLQLSIHFGTVPYVTDPLSNIDDLKDPSKFPRLTMDQMLDKLIASVSALPYLSNYSTTTAITGATNTSLINTVDGYKTQYMFINKRALLGDLYLWKGNYTLAATNYKVMLEYSTSGAYSSGSNSYYQVYKPNYGDVTNPSISLNVFYTRYQDQNTLSLIDNNNQGWRSIFGRTEDVTFDEEFLWMLNFDQNFQPGDPFIDLFSNQGGSYLLTASQYAIDNWNNQTENNGFPFDQRGRMSVKTINGQPVIAKYLFNYLDQTTFVPTNILQKTGRWFLYRSATLNLRFAEAANRDGRGKLAYAMVNVGIYGVFSPPAPLPTDVTNIQQTFDTPPYDFDARNGNAPSYRAEWYRQIGTRSRANLVPLPTTLQTDMLGMESAIVDEDGLEMAFEGERWGDLMRVAMHRNDPSFLAEKVYQKLFRDNNPAAATVRAKLLNTANWYLPFNW